jgi:DNA replication and repair protein recF
MKYEKDISLHEWDLQLARLAAYIVNKRKESLEKISVVVKEIYRNLTSEKEIVKLTYIQPYKGSTVEDTEDVYYELLRKNREKDIYRQSTSIGPHRDDFVVENDFGELKKFGSQGQQRTAVLALKMAELEFIKKENGEYPILLLDDVMSELDEERRIALLSFVQGKVQTFITTTDDSFFRKEKEYSFLYVEKGKVRYDEHKKRNN